VNAATGPAAAPAPDPAASLGPQAATAAVWMFGVAAGYDHRAALEDVDLELPAGSLAAVFGPNGGGKTTLLKLIAGLLRPWSGTIEVLGEPAGHAARRIAYVPQAEQVDWSFPVSVWDVAMMGRYARLGAWRRPGAQDNEIVRGALGRVGMLDRRSSQIGALSGG
jgi:ABC-type Mn2+/Zn2+ transport system ATPase subunit